jgi:hypothetical protein
MVVDRGRVSVRKALLNRNSSLPEKAEGFTTLPYPEGYMVCGVALQTTPLNVNVSYAIMT